MFTSKRVLKKDRSKKKLRFLLKFFFFTLILLIVSSLVYINFFSTNSKFISPIVNGSKTSVDLLSGQLQNYNISFSKVTDDNNGLLIVYLADGGEVILSSKKDLRSQVSSLQLILSRLTIEGKKLKILDLRFNYPVISF